MAKSVRELRAAHAEETPGGQYRTASFPAELRSNMVTQNGKQYLQVEGYATVYNRSYTMWDMFGSYQEVADSHMLDRSLAMGPDVAFLMNHTGMTMARTTNGSLTLANDSHGLKSTALLNMERQDVRDLASAMSDNLITEMSFAFMIDDGKWSDDFETFTLNQVDINRGDVSAVNYGANPYTNIGARANDFLREAERMPPAVQREAVTLMARKDPDGGVMRAAYMAVRAREADRWDYVATQLGLRIDDEDDISNWPIVDETDDPKPMPKSSDAGADPIDPIIAQPVQDKIDPDHDMDSDDDDFRIDGNSADARSNWALKDDEKTPAEQSDGNGRRDSNSGTAKRSADLFAHRWDMITDDTV